MLLCPYWCRSMGYPAIPSHLKNSSSDLNSRKGSSQKMEDTANFWPILTAKKNIYIYILLYIGFHILITITIIFLGNQWEPTFCHLLMLFSALPGSCSIPKLGFKSLLSISFYSCSIYINIYIAYRFLMYSRFHGSGRRPGTKLDSSKLDAPSFSSKSPKAVPVVKAAPPSRNTRQPQVAVTLAPIAMGEYQPSSSIQYGDGSKPGTPGEHQNSW